MTLRVLDLFSGIGGGHQHHGKEGCRCLRFLIFSRASEGFSLGLERTGGFETVAFCEIEPYCRAVLAKHWPGVPCYEDVRTLTADALQRDGISVDVICGGFPCQDISFAGKRAGLEGARSGLWREYARLIGELRPRFVIVENVPGLLTLGLGAVLGDLASLGYDATWDCIPASAVSAPHRRDRVWIVAHAIGVGLSERDGIRPRGQKTDAAVEAHHGWEFEPDVGRVVARLSTEMDGGGLNDQMQQKLSFGYWPHERNEALGIWEREPDEPRIAKGVKDRVVRLKGLGNAVVPQIPEIIGRAILQAEGLAA